MGGLLKRLRARPEPLALRTFAGEQVGPYRVRRLLAETAAGCVLQVEGGLLKLWLDGASDPTDRAWLEARATAACDPPRLRVLEHGVLEERDYYVAQELPEPLLCDVPLPPDLDSRLEIADQITDALRACGDSMPRLFSAAQFAGTRIDSIGVPTAPPKRHAALVAGDVPVSRRLPWPVPPEAVADKPLDVRTSVWCLGYLVYEVLVGAHPYSGLDPSMLALAPIMENPIPPRQHNRAISSRIERLLLQSLSRDPALRPDLSTVRWLT